MCSHGDTFINQHRPQIGMPSHLWVVISDPLQDPDNVVVVNISSNRLDAFYEKTCEFLGGEHPFIAKKCVVLYGRAKWMSTANIRKGISMGLLKPEQPADSMMLTKILSGASVTKELSRDMKAKLKEQGLI